MYDVDVLNDLTYAKADNKPLLLDLYRPRVRAELPVVLYLHGGGYRAGDKADNAPRLRGLAAHGVAVASANYRLVPHATYPAQLHDAKAAIRWLRATGAEHGLAPERIGVWGASAGGYLASMLGLTDGDPTLEGTVGTHLTESSSVHAVVAWFAPSDLLVHSHRTHLEQTLLDEPAEYGLIGPVSGTDRQAILRDASPTNHAHPGAPPFLIASGDRDRIVSELQGRALHDALARAGANVTHAVLGGAGHEDPIFDCPAHLAATAAWLNTQLRPTASARPTPAMPPGVVQSAGRIG